ncbi:breast cancer type 1 susceptibility protein isoform X2 [Rhineura floridana]|uniref:breast cancer type 1 susceptibility protein isoform X2 n=1 Tax=Rhineura floridana TaxID=261503 RepID=UPI002AC833F8|nr:breast cancer type 1 susceptibility protein isoform X2 [Rhineura floridana]
MKKIIPPKNFSRVTCGLIAEHGIISPPTLTSFLLPVGNPRFRSRDHDRCESGVEDTMDSSIPSIAEVHGTLLAMQKNLECPICLEVMKNPISTNCAHIFCSFCMFKLLGQKKGVAQCPLCKAKVTKRSLWKDTRFKEVIKVVLETIHAFECDTGFKFSDDQCFPKKAIEAACASVPWKEKEVIDCKGYRDRLRRVKEAKNRNTNLGETSDLPLVSRTVTRHSLRKKSNSSKAVIFEIGSDSPEDVFKKADAIRCVGFRSSSLSQVGKGCAKNQSQSPCDVELPEPSVEDEAFNILGVHGFLEEGLGSTKGTLANTENLEILEKNAAVGKSQDLSFPDPCLGQPERNASSIQEDGSCCLLSMAQLVGEAAKPTADKQVDNDAEKASMELPSRSAQISYILHENEEQLPQSHTSPDSSLSQVSGKKLIRSIQKVNEWLSKSKEVLSPSSLQDIHTEEVDQDPNLSDADSLVSQKTELLMEDQGVFTVECEGDRSLSKPAASKIEDKIFGRTYKRERKSNLLWNERETNQIQAKEGIAVNSKSCDIPIKRILMQKRKASSELTPVDFTRRQDMQVNRNKPGGDEDNVLEEDGKALGDESLVGDQKEIKLPVELPVKEGVSVLEADGSETSLSVCHKLPESNLKNLKEKSNTLSKRSRQIIKPISALQLIVDRSARSSKKANVQTDDELKVVGVGQVQVRRSRRLQLQPEGAWRRSEPVKRGIKQMNEKEKKCRWSHAGNMPTPSTAESDPSVFHGRPQKDISWSDASLINMEDNANGACANPATSPQMNVEQTTDSHGPCCNVPSANSQDSCSLLQFASPEVEQTTSEDKQFMVGHQTGKSVLCPQTPEGGGLCTGNVMGSFKPPETYDKATGTLELNPETDDSELDTNFMRKMFSGCKRRSFLLHPRPVKESVTEIQKEPSNGWVEDGNVDCLKKSTLINRCCEERREAFACEVNSSVQRLASCTSSFPDRTEHPQLASQDPFPDHPSTPELLATRNAKGERHLQSQKLATKKRAFPKMGGEIANSNGSSSSGSQSVWRNDIFQSTSLGAINETSTSIGHSQGAGSESTENKGLALSSQPESIQPCQLPHPEFSCIHGENNVEQKQLNSDTEEATDNSSTGVPKCLVPRKNLEQCTEEESHGFELLSETPEGLLGLVIRNEGSPKGSPNLREIDRKDNLAVSLKTNKQPTLESDLDNSNKSSSKLNCKSLAWARQRRVQKLPSSEEEHSSEDEELPCFQALIFGKSARTLEPVKKETSEGMLALQSSSKSNLKTKDDDVSPSQESECSVNLFSFQSHVSEDFSSRPHDSRHLTPAPTSNENLATVSGNKKAIQPRDKVSRYAEQLKDGQQEYVNSESNLGETMEYDSEASCLGDSLGLSSQNEILTTQQRGAMQNSLKKLQQKMAILEAVLKQGSQNAVHEGSPLSDEDDDFTGETRSANGQHHVAQLITLGSKANLRSNQSFQDAFSPHVSMHATSVSHAISSSRSKEQISRCLATETARGPLADTCDTGRLSTPRHKGQRSPVCPLLPTTHCSARKRNSESPLLTSKRNMSLVASGLNQGELRLVQKFARKSESTWSNNISKGTSHVVMKTDEDLVCERTLKYFLGIAGQKWVVSYQWIVQSLKERRVLNEDDFEVRGDVINGRSHQGPRRARESPSGKLFQGLEICCHGPFTDMLPEQLEWMVELCGASLVKEPHLFTHATNSTAVVVIQPEAWGEDTACQDIPLQYSATVVSREWVLDSVACYQRQAFDEYIMQQL